MVTHEDPPTNRRPLASRNARRLSVALIAGALSLAGGCAGLSDFKYESTQKLRAVSELADCGIPACERYPHDYKLGFLDGFYSVSTGGSNCPPAVAPQRYWKPKRILEECDNRRHSYYSGWQDGAARATCYPDTHHLRLFESCECQIPKCQDNCGAGACVDVGSCGESVTDGMIHAEWAESPTHVTDEHAIYENNGLLPVPQAVETAPSVATPVMPAPVVNAAPEPMAEVSVGEIPPPPMAIPQGETVPPPVPNVASESAMKEQPVSPSDLPAVTEPVESIEAIEAVPEKPKTDEVPPPKANGEDAASDGSIDGIPRTAEAPHDSKLVNDAEAPTLNRDTIQSLFGMPAGFDFKSTGPVSYQSFDPVREQQLPKETIKMLDRNFDLGKDNSGTVKWVP